MFVFSLFIEQMTKSFRPEPEETCQRQNDNVFSTLVDGQLNLDSNVAKKYYPTLHHCYNRYSGNPCLFNYLTLLLSLLKEYCMNSAPAIPFSPMLSACCCFQYRRGHIP